MKLEKLKTKQLNKSQTQEISGGRLFEHGSFLDTVCTIVAGESYEAFNDFLDK